MQELSVSQFRSNPVQTVDRAVSNHEILKITRKQGRDFVVLSAEDWEQLQETLYVLQNQSLMRQIADSLNTHISRAGYIPTQEEVDEIVSI